MTVTTRSSTDQLSPAAAEFLLAFADDEHMVGARHTAWIGMGPFLEEDLAFCSIAQDELGHAISLYEFITDDIDRFALLRAPEDYRSCDLAELACDDWQDALVRHWLYDRAEELRWGALTGSTNQRLSEIALRSQREESFHRAHAASFMSRIAASGDADSIAKVTSAVERILPIALHLWEPSPREAEAVSEGFVTRSSQQLSQDWKALVTEDLQSWDLSVSWPMASEDSSGRLDRSEGFASFLASLQEVILIDPEADWW